MAKQGAKIDYLVNKFSTSKRIKDTW
jgi:hypothetical protein